VDWRLCRAHTHGAEHEARRQRTYVLYNATDTKSNVLQKFTDKLKDKVDAYRVGHHGCEHDEETIISQVTDEEWVAEPGTAVALANDDLLKGTVTVTDSNGGVRTTYSVDHAAGTITANLDGTLTDGTKYFVDYEYYENRVHQCSFDPTVDPDAAAVQWTAKDVTIPSGVPDFPSAAYDQAF